MVNLDPIYFISCSASEARYQGYIGWRELDLNNRILFGRWGLGGGEVNAKVVVFIWYWEVNIK